MSEDNFLKELKEMLAIKECYPLTRKRKLYKLQKLVNEQLVNLQEQTSTLVQLKQTISREINRY